MNRLREQSWIWLLTLYTIASFIEVVFWAQMSAFTPLYLLRLGIAPGQVTAWTGAIAALAAVVGLPFLPFWGALADRYSRQPVIIRSFLAHLAAGVIAMLAGNIWVFVLARAVQSLSLGNSGLMLTTLSERTPHKRTGLAFAIMNSAPALGGVVGPLLGGPVYDTYGFPALLSIDVVLILAVTLALSFGYKDNYVGTRSGSIFRMALAGIGIIARSRRLRTLFPALFLLFAGWMLAFTYLPLVVTLLYRGNDPGTATGLVIGAGGATTLVVGPLLGGLADRFGHWRVLFIASAFAVALWPLPALAPDLVTFGAAWAAVNGVASGIFAISFSVLASSAAADVRGRVMTFSYLPVNIGYAAGPAMGSVITRYSIFAIFPAAAVLTALGMAALYFAARQPVSGAVSASTGDTRDPNPSVRSALGAGESE